MLCLFYESYDGRSNVELVDCRFQYHPSLGKFVRGSDVEIY